ncbi:MAG: hypothetical protein KDB32_02125 [Planctomycetes bacterium]|nr:hypothetical protein [Planctomycetota bacterium]
MQVSLSVVLAASISLALIGLPDADVEDDAEVKDASITFVHLNKLDGPKAISRLFKFANPGEGYFTADVDGGEPQRTVYWLNGDVAKQVLTEEDAPLTADSIWLIENKAHVFAIIGPKDARHLYVLESGKSYRLNLDDDKPLTATSFEVYGPKPEYVQIKGKPEFYRLEGHKAKPIALPDFEPAIKYPTLVVSPTGTYFYARNTLLGLTPGRLWLLSPDDKLKRVKWEDGGDAELGIAFFHFAGDTTYAVINDYESQRDPDAEYVERYLWTLKDDVLSIATDGEGYEFQAAALITNAVVGSRIYLPGWSEDSDDMFIWTAKDGGEFTLVKAQGKPLSAADFDVFDGGDVAVIRRKVRADLEPEFWICEGESARPVKTSDGKVLQAKGFAQIENGTGLLVTFKDDHYHLFSIDDNDVVRPGRVDGEPVVAKGSMFVQGMNLYAGTKGQYCRISRDNEEDELLFFRKP